MELELIKLCAVTDRGQRASANELKQLTFYIEALEDSAPAAQASDLNGRWRLLGAVGEAAYRSSPFFWAFRQATAKYSTPIGIPSGKVESGGSIASAVYAITDAIPLYDIGSVEQRFSDICSPVSGCEVGDEQDVLDAWKGDPLNRPPTTKRPTVDSEDVPSEGRGSSSPPPPAAALTSEVELVVGRLFGLPTVSSTGSHPPALCPPALCPPARCPPALHPPAFHPPAFHRPAFHPPCL